MENVKIKMKNKIHKMEILVKQRDVSFAIQTAGL